MLEGFEKYLAPSTAATEARNPALFRDFQAGVSRRKAMDSAIRSGNLSALTGIMGMDAAAISGGLAFLEAELEKRDPKVREPLTSVTWMRDIVVKSGGGWVDFTSFFSANYAISGPNQYGLTGGQTTTIPIVQTDIEKDIYPVYAWQNILKVNFIDMQKLQGAGRSLDDLLDKGIKLNWNKSLDLVTYQGWGGLPGLVNNTAVTAGSVAKGAGGFTGWSIKTPTEILLDVNTAMATTWTASNYDVTGMACHFLIPPNQYALLCQINSAAGDVSVLTYLLENNIGKTQGIDLKIFPSRWCSAAGSGGTDRMVCYVSDIDRVRLNVTVPIQRVMTTPNISEGGGAYLTLYAGQIGVPEFLYLQPFLYQDGI
jgi:hypothetical protein